DPSFPPRRSALAAHRNRISHRDRFDLVRVLPHRVHLGRCKEKEAVAISTAKGDLAFVPPAPECGSGDADVLGDIRGGEIGRSRDSDAGTRHLSRFHVVSPCFMKAYDIWMVNGKSPLD